jgi:hypothetical protein
MSAVARRIPCHHRISANGGVYLDEKIWRRRLLGAAPPSIAHKRFAREKGSFVLYRLTVEHGLRKSGIEFFDQRIPNLDLGVDDRIDNEAMAIGGTLDRLRRPGKPTRIPGHDVEMNIGVDQHRRHSVIPGQRHDRIRGHRDVATSSQMSDDLGTATIPLAGFGPNDAPD